MDRSAQATESGDGRTVMFAEWGDLSGSPVVALHGTPGCRLSRHPNEDLVRSAGVHLITYDRAGYGGSDRHRARSVADCAADVAAVVDALGLGRFAVMGASGGGPHALAVAALLDDRVTRAICRVGIAPFDALGNEWFAGMDPGNAEEFGWALEGEARLTAELERESERMRQVAAADPSALLDQFDLAPSDKEVLAREDIAQMFRESVLEETRNGVWGWVDDDIAFVTSWGFDPSTITVPVQVRYGTSDVLVPAAHGAWIAGAVPGADVRSSGLGHFGDPDVDLVDSLAWLTAPDD